jgi:hypothetical protein
MTKFTASELADFYHKIAYGGVAEYKVHNKGVWITAAGGPNPNSLTKDWRIKPTKKVIDLSVLIDGIDCEVSNNSIKTNNWEIRQLQSIYSDGNSGWPYRTEKGTHEKCRPRMNHKHAWQGGDCPLPEGFEVNAWMRGAKTTEARLCTDLRWDHTEGLMDIMYFEVLRVADGYVMPGEVSDD